MRGWSVGNRTEMGCGSWEEKGEWRTRGGGVEDKRDDRQTDGLACGRLNATVAEM